MCSLREEFQQIQPMYQVCSNTLGNVHSSQVFLLVCCCYFVVVVVVVVVVFHW